MASPMKIRATTTAGVTEVKALMSHPMETGRRKDADGQLVPAHYITEVTAQTEQLPAVWAAFRDLRQPVVFVHGDDDTFVPLEADQRIAAEYGHTLVTVPGGDHFLNACCASALLGAFEQAISEAEGREAAQPPATQPSDPDPAGGPTLQ